MIEIFTSSQGSTGTKVSSRSGLLSALTISGGAASIAIAQDWANGITAASGGNAVKYGLFAGEDGSTISLNQSGLSMGVFEQAVANIAYLRAQSGGGMSRLNFAADSLSSMETMCSNRSC